MACPECLSDEVIVHEYDFGICPQTGYHDAGERFWCRACGATGDADDLVPIEECNSISVGSSERAAGGG
jgi:rubredoxin